ncbi:MAG: carboxypeptidase-like regulatory domain-containing protein, partial [Methanospirillum sp.]|uniref:carboxypeptidase-like regulatory domain-containing protein n=1 Tax=Methanospirillum sp. TaxID=45200 RepID=UPI002372F878
MKQPISVSRTLTIGSILGLFLVLSHFMPVSAADIPGVIGQYDGWEFEDSPTVGMGIFPVVTLEPKAKSTLTIEDLPGKSATQIWVTISPFISTLSGKKTHLIVGYLNGARAGTSITIAGKASGQDYQDLATIRPDEKGLFVWPVPSTDSDLDLYRVTAVSGTNQAISNAIRFTPSNTSDVVIKPVVSPIQTVIPMATSDSALPVLTRLTISASTATPRVGQDVVISGRLTDQDGHGISGATITIDETGYPGASSGEPFVTTQTGSDGRFDYTLSVRFANSVGLVANYQGDEDHKAAESNTLSFTSFPE